MTREEATELARRYLGWLDRLDLTPPTEKPAAPIGDRILLRQMPDSPGRVLHKSAEEQVRPFAGLIVGAGDKACDQLYDAGAEFGDEVWIGKYAGVQEEWKHWIRNGDGKCKSYSDHSFLGLKHDVEGSKARHCELCDAVEVTEPMVVCNVKDIIANIDVQRRFERGELKRFYAVNSKQETQFTTRRTVDMDRSTWDENNETKLKAVTSG